MKVVSFIIFFNYIYLVSASWSVEHLTSARYQIGATASGTKVYFAGGELDNGAGTKQIDIYDTSALTWSSKSLTDAKKALGAASTGNYVAFGGGSVFMSGPTTAVEIYNTNSNSWSATTLSSARHSLTGVAVGAKLLFVGGYDEMTIAQTTIDIFDTSNSMARTTATMPSEGYQFLVSSTYFVAPLLKQLPLEAMFIWLMMTTLLLKLCGSFTLPLKRLALQKHTAVDLCTKKLL